VNVGSESYQKYQLNQEIDNFKIEIEELEKNNKQLADLMEYLKKEPYLEREARLKLNLMKPGEKVIILPDESIQEASVTENIIESSSEEETANYWEWWQYFFSR